jgi:type 1 glutamine amidotransferase
LKTYEDNLEKWNTRQEEVKAAQGEFDQALKTSLAKLSPANLKNFDAVIFANTTGDLPLPDRQGFIDWVKNGRGFVAMHSGSDTFHGFRPYIEMLGGEFESHGAQVGVECLVQDPKHPSTRDLGESFCIEQEEIYLIKSFDRAGVHNLLALDKHPNRKKEPGFFPIAWCKDYGQGKVFYTSLGHREDVWENKRYQKHILGGIKWALGLEAGDATPGN